jgi:ATP-dependent helicase/nuclease subunit A
MTRAEDRLILCGYHGVNPPRNATWLLMAEAGLRNEAETTEQPLPDGRTALRFQVSRPRSAEGSSEPLPRGEALPGLPDFLLRNAPAPIRLPRPLAPSRAGALIEPSAEDAPPLGSPVLGSGKAEPSLAIQRGTAIHRLLQMLPDMAPADRPAAAERYLTRAGAAWPNGEREAAARSVLAILEDPTFAALFAPGSRAEVAVMGTLDINNTPRAIAGTIDRLAVTDQAVLILDYKTNRPPPATLAEVPPAYLVQLALYRALLSDLYPGRTVEAALLFTEAPRLIAVEAAELDRALAGLARPKQP